VKDQPSLIVALSPETTSGKTLFEKANHSCATGTASARATSMNDGTSKVRWIIKQALAKPVAHQHPIEL
jgi:hypothetical protein